MKILQVVNRFHPYIGGTENYVYNLAKELVKLGHKVTVICANEPKVKSGIIDGVNVIRTKYIFKIANTNITPFLPFEILRHDFDILHNYIPHPWSADWATLISLIKRKPMILTYHNDIPEKGKYKILIWIYNSFFLKIILTISKVIISTQKNYINTSKSLKKFENKIEIVPCGVDLEKFYPLQLEKSNLKKIFFLSILDGYHRYKGLDYLLKAFLLVLDRRKDVLLVVGGEGVLRKEYEEMAANLGISKYVDFVGKIPENELNRYFNECDIFVLPSISSEQEGFGIVALEAMACLKPVIVTDIIGTSKEIEEFQSGKVISPYDTEALAYTIVDLLADRDICFKMGNNGRKLVEDKFSWEKITKEIIEIYKTLI